MAGEATWARNGAVFSNGRKASSFATIINVVPDQLTRTTEPDFQSVPPALMAHAVDTFGDPMKARAWLTTPNPVLSNLQPIEIARTSDGLARVEEVLTRIDYGIFS